MTLIQIGREAVKGVENNRYISRNFPEVVSGNVDGPVKRDLLPWEFCTF